MFYPQQEPSKTAEVLAKIGVCPTCYNKVEKDAFFMTPEGQIHCGCIWNAAEIQRAMMATKGDTIKWLGKFISVKL